MPTGSPEFSLGLVLATVQNAAVLYVINRWCFTTYWKSPTQPPDAHRLDLTFLLPRPYLRLHFRLSLRDVFHQGVHAHRLVTAGGEGQEIKCVDGKIGILACLSRTPSQVLTFRSPDSSEEGLSLELHQMIFLVDILIPRAATRWRSITPSIFHFTDVLVTVFGSKVWAVVTPNEIT